MKVLLYLVIFLSSCSSIRGIFDSNPESKLVLLNARIVNFESGKFGPATNLLIVKGKIKKVGYALAAADKTETKDLNGAFLIPGLIDLHTHLFLFQKNFDQNLERDLLEEINHSHSQERINKAKVRASEMLESGFTSIRDLGNSNQFLAQGLKKKRHFPRIYSSGPGLAFYPGQFSVGTDKAIIQNEYQLLDDEENIKQLITKFKFKGADLIKVYVDSPKMTDSILNKIVRSSHRLKMPVSAHSESLSGCFKAAKASVDSIEHGLKVSNSCLKMMAQKKIILVPTDPPLRLLKQRAGQMQLKSGWAKKWYQQRALRLQRAYRKKVPLAFGSDLFYDSPTHFGKLSLEALLSYKRAGLSNLTILKMATTNAAKLLNRENLIGTVRENAYADLIALKANPLKKLATLKNPIMVMKNGKVQ